MPHGGAGVDRVIVTAELIEIGCQHLEILLQDIGLA